MEAGANSRFILGAHTDLPELIFGWLQTSENDSVPSEIPSASAVENYGADKPWSRGEFPRNWKEEIPTPQHMQLF